MTLRHGRWIFSLSGLALLLWARQQPRWGQVDTEARNPLELQAAEREEGAALWQAGVELEGFSYSLVVKIELVMLSRTQTSALGVGDRWGREGSSSPWHPCTLTPLSKARVVLLSHPGAADHEQSAVSQLQRA